MPRLARSVFANMPHHITQRGNRREDVFFDDAEEALLVLRRNAMMGLACGSDRFIRKIEKLADRPLRYRPRGRPRRAESGRKDG